MDIEIKSINDRSLLHITGFYCTPEVVNGKLRQSLDSEKLANFCGVSTRTVRHWMRIGLPSRVRIQLENLHSGEYLPPAWRNAGIRVVHDGVMLRCGTHVSIDSIAFWKFIVYGVDWERVRLIEDAVNAGRRLPLTISRPLSSGQQLPESVILSLKINKELIHDSI